MKIRYTLLLAIITITLSFTTKVLDDDSINYVKVGNIHLPHEICNQGWAVMINSSGQGGGPNKNIRVYYTFNNRPMVCDTKPLPAIPNPDQIYTLLGCWGGNYVITRSEYIP